MERPLRVLYILNSPGGGATQGIIELLKGLPRTCFEAYFVLPNAPNTHQQATFDRLGVTWRVVPIAWWNRNIQQPFLWRILLWGRSVLRTGFRVRTITTLRKLIRTWDIDVVYTGTSMNLEGALAAHLCGVPHVWHIKETIGVQGRVKFPLPDSLLRRLITGLSARVFVMTEFIGQVFKGKTAKDNVVVVYDGVDVESFIGDNKGSALRQTLGIADDEVLVAMSASLSATWKQHTVFIQMAARLVELFPRVRFAAFGAEPKHTGRRVYERPWHYYQDLKKQVSRLGLEKQFVWAGFHPDIPQIMDAIDILVHPCAHEPFGRVAIEAMAARKPVVGPSTGGIAESVVDGETGFLVEPGNPKSFAEAVMRLLVDTNLRQQMGEAGRRRVATQFSLEQHVQQVATLLNEVTGRSKTA